MRISKVSVKDNNGKNVMVQMYRTNEEGALVFEGKTDDKTGEILPDLKIDSFHLSLLNKVIVKKLKKGATQTEIDLHRNLTKVMRSLIYKDNIWSSDLKAIDKETTKEAIEKCISSKFKSKIKYQLNGREDFFILSELLLEDIKDERFNKLKQFREWQKIFIEDKSQHLITSIDKNKIAPNNESNNRQKALQEWADEYVIKGDNIDFEQKEFGINDLALKLKNRYEKYEETSAITDSIQKKEKQSNKDLLLLNYDIKGKYDKILSEFHRALKITLQAHQKEIFGSKDAPNTENRNNAQLHTYQMEVVKYLERYFPVKASKRTKTEADILYYLNKDTIKTTVKNQILNSVRARLLQQGKAIHHNYDETINSTRLSDIKRNEAFVLNLIDACAFAANNIRNIVFKDLSDDILGKGGVEKQSGFLWALHQNKVDEPLFKLFFNHDLPEETDNKTLWAMRGAVQQIRNNIVHYKQEALDKIFKVESFEFPDQENSNYTESLFKVCLEKEIFCRKHLPNN